MRATPRCARRVRTLPRDGDDEYAVPRRPPPDADVVGDEVRVACARIHQSRLPVRCAPPTLSVPQVKRWLAGAQSNRVELARPVALNLRKRS